MAQTDKSRPWVVDFRWSTGQAGRSSYREESQARRVAAEIRAAGENRDDGAGVTVRVRHRSELVQPKARQVREAPEVGAMLDRMLAAMVRRAGEGDVEALQELCRIERELPASISRAGQQLHASGQSFGYIAAELGISRQAAAKRFGGAR